LIVLDLMLPGMDGLEICRRLRSESSVPIIMLTARTTEEDRLCGLDTGADDYVTKPFSPRELAARVRAVLRRTSEDMPGGPVEVSHGDLKVNLAKHEAYLSGKPLNLTPTEFKLLSVFIKDPERVFSRSQLIDKAFGFDFEGFDRTMDVHIHNLRGKLRTASGDQNYIVTVYGAGYRLLRARS
jgi:two-component system, OmpR family, alkaline phosphatase synthesis response regulator PhoP